MMVDWLLNHLKEVMSSCYLPYTQSSLESGIIIIHVIQTVHFLETSVDIINFITIFMGQKKKIKPTRSRRICYAIWRKSEKKTEKNKSGSLPKVPCIELTFKGIQAKSIVKRYLETLMRVKLWSLEIENHWLIKITLYVSAFPNHFRWACVPSTMYWYNKEKL